MIPENFNYDRMIPFYSKEDIKNLSQDDKVLLVDVRSDKELEKQPMIQENAYHHAWPMGASNPADNFTSSFDLAKTEGKERVIVYCASGKRAYKAAKALREKYPDALKTKIGVYQGSTGDWYNTGLQQKKDQLFFRHFYDKAGASWTNTYLLADTKSKEAILIDSVWENFDRDIQQVKELGFNLKYLVETHIHVDHITASHRFRSDKSNNDGMKHVVGADNKMKDHPDVVKVQPGDLVEFGDLYLVVISTPGHTSGCVSYFLSDMSRVFTGDCLLIRGTGRTDFQAGDANEMYDSILNRLYTLPDDVKVMCAHNYDGMTESTIKEEKEFNKRIPSKQTREEFTKIMKNLKLAEPRIMHIAGPLNANLGDPSVIPS